MVMKSKETLKKTWKDNFKKVFKVKWVGDQWTPNIPGAMQKRSKKSYKITNQKGAFGKIKTQPMFDPNETNKMRFVRRRNERLVARKEKKDIIEDAKGLLTRKLGE